MSTEEKDLEVVAEPEVEVQAEAAVTAPAEAKKPARGKARKAVDPAVWEGLKQSMEDGEVLSVKINDAVKAGVISYVNGVRGFIPASLLSIAYVEKLEDWVGKTIDVKVITVEPEEKRLVLSGKAVEKEKAAADAAAKLEALAVGDVFDGTVERLAPFGVFVKFNDSLSGLVHISQMANKRVETPDEVCKVGDTVKVRVIGKEEGKIRLSMKQAAATVEKENFTPAAPAAKKYKANDPEFAYKEEGKAVTGLADLLKGIKLD